jgi:acyl carrier protein
MEVTNMYEKLVAFAAEHLELDPTEITPESTFEDLGIDSLDIVEMVMELEGELGVDLEVEDETITTFGQMAAFIESKVG